MNSTLTPQELAHSNGRDVVDAAITMGCLEVFFIVLYFVSRFKIKTPNAVDAYLMIPAFLFSFSLLIICFSRSSNTSPNLHRPSYSNKLTVINLFLVGVHSAGVGRHWATLFVHLNI